MNILPRIDFALLFLPILMGMGTSSGCGHYEYHTQWQTSPTRDTWESTLASQRPLVLYFGEDKFQLDEPHLEGNTLVATLGRKLPPDSISMPWKKSVIALPKGADPAQAEWAQPAYIFTNGVVSTRGMEVRLDRENVSAIKTFTLRKADGFWMTLLAALLLAVIIGLKIWVSSLTW